MVATKQSASSASKADAGRSYRYAMISSEVRRDLQNPLQYFERLDITHFYRSAPWDDLKHHEYNERMIRFRTPFDLYWNLRKARPEIIQGPEPLSILMVPFLVTTLIYLYLHPRIKLVTLSLEPIPLEEKYHPLIAPVYRWILKRWFKRAAVIFWLDTASKQNLLANGADPARLVYLMYGSWGIDLDEFSPVGNRAQIGSGNEPVILYVGRLNRVKGVRYLLEAFSILRMNGMTAHLAIVGDGPEREALHNHAIKLGIQDDVSWFGAIKNADLPPYMRAATLLVLPGITTKLWVQQLSITAWQAMGCGLPVVATDTGCMREFTPDDTGILVPERDPNALAVAIQRILNDSQLHSLMSTAARSYAEHRFDAPKNVRIAEQTVLDWTTNDDGVLK